MANVVADEEQGSPLPDAILPVSSVYPVFHDAGATEGNNSVGPTSPPRT